MEVIRNECISKLKVIQILQKAYTEGKIQAKDGLVSILDDINAADVQPIRRGKWIVDKDFYTCSRCNHQYLIDKILSMTIYPSGGMPYYCPCCGADMREATKG